MEYLDFELEIGLGSGPDYAVTVVHSPAGEARATMRFPFDKLELENNLLKLQNTLLRSGGQRRTYLTPERQSVQDFGSALFEALFAGEVRSRYDVSLERARRDHKGLRLKLRIQPPELAALPWEFLFDPRQADYICLYSLTPIVRYLELPQAIQPLTITPPLRILGMIASPSGLPPLNVAREKQRVEMALADLRARDLVELTWLPGQTGQDLQRAMRHGPWHVFHFIGHGGFDRIADEGFIAVADPDGEISRLKASDLGRLLGDHPPLRLALLSACDGARAGDRDIFSSTAATLLRRGVPAVVAMQYEVTDEAAIEFARAFYEALADAVPVDAAVSEARKAISRMASSTLEWGTPVLFMHSPDGVLFDIQQSAPETTQPLERIGRELAVGGWEQQLSPELARQHQPAWATEKTQRSPEETSPREEPEVEPAKSQGLPAQSASQDGLRRLRTVLAVVGLPVLAAVIGILFILPGVFRPEVSTSSPTAVGAGSAMPAILIASTPTAGDAGSHVPSIVVANSASIDTSGLAQTPVTAITQSTPEPTAMHLPTPTVLPPGSVRLEETIYGRFDPNIPADIRLDAGRFYRPSGEPPIGDYCHAEFPPDGLVWVLCADIGLPEPTDTPAPQPTATAQPEPPSAVLQAAPALQPSPTSLPSPVPPTSPPLPTLSPTPTTPTSVTYRVDIMAISLEKMKTLPGCENAFPIHNACIVGPGNVHMAVESLNTNEAIPVSSDVRLVTMNLSPTRIRVVSDGSGLPITTIGGNELVPQLGQYYEIRLEKIG